MQKIIKYQTEDGIEYQTTNRNGNPVFFKLKNNDDGSLGFESVTGSELDVLRLPDGGTQVRCRTPLRRSRDNGPNRGAGPEGKR